MHKVQRHRLRNFSMKAQYMYTRSPALALRAYTLVPSFNSQRVSSCCCNCLPSILTDAVYRLNITIRMNVSIKHHATQLRIFFLEDTAH